MVQSNSYFLGANLLLVMFPPCVWKFSPKFIRNEIKSVWNFNVQFLLQVMKSKSEQLSDYLSRPSLPSRVFKSVLQYYCIVLQNQGKWKWHLTELKTALKLTNSTPITPAPIRIIFSGTLFKERAPVEEIITFSSICGRSPNENKVSELSCSTAACK